MEIPQSLRRYLNIRKITTRRAGKRNKEMADPSPIRPATRATS
jgi:hypothetical protein